jgi:mannose-6-phosphate isomerase-like protein (cupin superfamily)
MSPLNGSEPRPEPAGDAAEPTADAAEPTADAAEPTADAAEPTADPPASVRPVDLRDYVRFSQETATRVRVFASGHLALDLWCVEPQQATPVLHLPDRDVTYTVVGGRSWFVTDDGEVGLDPLGAMLVPAGVVHGIDNRAPDPLIVVAVSSPPASEEEDAPVEATGGAVRYERAGPGPVRRFLDRVFGGRGRG